MRSIPSILLFYRLVRDSVGFGPSHRPCRSPADSRSSVSRLSHIAVQHKNIPFKPQSGGVTVKHGDLALTGSIPSLSFQGYLQRVGISQVLKANLSLKELERSAESRCTILVAKATSGHLSLNHSHQLTWWSDVSDRYRGLRNIPTTQARRALV